MTQQEFFQRTGVKVSISEFELINGVYLCSDCDKDTFCLLWCKMNYNRIANAKEKAKKEAKKDKLRGRTSRILLKVEKQMFDNNRKGDICKSAVLTNNEKKFLLSNAIICSSALECSAGGLYFILSTELTRILLARLLNTPNLKTLKNKQL